MDDGVRERRRVDQQQARQAAITMSKHQVHNEGYNLMAQSREQLTMDMNSKSENSIFTRPGGCYVSRSKGLVFAILFIALAVGVGFLTYHLTAPCGITLPFGDGTTSSGGAGSSSSSGGDSSSSNPAGTGNESRPKKVRDVRLPLTLRPIYYKLDLIPYIDPARNFTLEGTASIDILCVETTNRITLHIKNITIKESTVHISEKFNETEPGAGVGNRHALSILSHSYDADREFYNITVEQTLQPGHVYNVHIEYTGILSDELSGFYRSSYVDKASNETRWLAVTQFQPTDARRAFPCFDEPQFKAEFEVSLARWENMSSISNMDLRNSEPVSNMAGWIWDHYNKSVPMSTYLVAFVVSDFERLVSDPNLSRPKFQVWARKDAIEQAEYARDIGPRILTYYEQYFGIEFPLPKQDMIALPDFGAGAMENWGLITYRETAMLFDPRVSSDQNKQRVAVVIAHELAHQWFGNLVTPAWWNGLWLNEGFASYVEYLGTNHVQPDWKILDQFVTDEVQDVFGLDALDSSHPISVGVDHPDEINEIFDSISYAKGASILRMMNHFLTQSTFNRGLTNYLNKWKYGNTEQTNLWDALTEQAHVDRTLDVHMRVGEVMDTWTLQKGFPVINVERHYPQKSATFTQTKFSLIKNDNFTEEYRKYTWWVPISYASRSYNSDFNATNPQFWIPKGSHTYDHDVFVNKSEWLIVNVQETGYYRVNYDTKNWNLLIEQLTEDPTVIHTVNRAQMLDDALNLARAALLPYDLAFNVTQFLKKDDEYLPWEAFLNNLQYIYSMLLRTKSFGIFKKYNRELITVQYGKVGIVERPDDALLRKYHRINIVQTACSVAYEPCVENAKNLFGTWVNTSDPDTNNPIPMNLRRSIYCNGIRYGGEPEWDFLWQRYLSANVASEKSLILQSLACSRETWILNRYLQWAITPGSEIRKQDSRIVLSAVANNDIGNFLAFNFLRDKWSTIRKYFGTGFSMGGFIKSISGKFNTEFELTELRNFKKANENDLGSAARAVDQSIERVQANIEWMNNNFQTISDWLESQIS